ncbi:MAG: hypothetical protein AMR96_03810 [Candidatus Adiutrix intracellularis]|jgi:predicted RNA-binding Zn-ribbon protein involved in translation (DUF1610 family)|nr:MAG: hypothetical protein AMR96_03810 [Candidatus Adiutrix intracellularis]MDR2827199.1 hypothetical protein [Candidatus Adiutrix intracellularis]
MSDNLTSSIDKICQETDCTEKIAELTPEQRNWFKSFTYCPYCAEEMTLVCHNCHEQLTSSDFKFCPWCGAGFNGQ